MSNTKEERRQPAQARSKKRVDAILGAAKSLIAEKGSARLKISDISQRADVTPASIYQYFPNKNAITLALATQTFDHTYQMIAQNLPSADSEIEMYQLLQGLIERFYQVYLDDPAMYDVWVSISADKTFQDLDIEDSRRMADLVFQSIKSYYDEIHWEQILQVGFLLAHLSGAAVRMAISVGPQEGRSIIDSFKGIINPTFINSMLKAQGVELE